MSTEEEIAKAEATEVARTVATPGWKIIEKSLEDEIKGLRYRIETEADIDNTTTHLLSSGGDLKVVVVNIDKGYWKHAIRALRKFQERMKNWAEEKPDDA